jgi:hypothetical protein
MEFRRKWAPLIIFAGYSVALLVPAMMPSVEARIASPPAGVMTAADNREIMAANDAVMADLHAQASAALRELQASAAQPQ